MALIIVGVGTLTGCNNKGMEVPDASKAVIYDEKRDGSIVKEAGGPSTQKTDENGKKIGKKLPAPAK